MTKLAVLRVFAAAQAAIVLFWWLLSHWIYSEWYHGVMGFAPGSYNEDFVKIIGTMAIFPLAGLVHTALNPAAARPFLIGYAIFNRYKAIAAEIV